MFSRTDSNSDNSIVEGLLSARHSIVQDDSGTTISLSDGGSGHASQTMIAQTIEDADQRASTVSFLNDISAPYQNEADKIFLSEFLIKNFFNNKLFFNEDACVVPVTEDMRESLQFNFNSITAAIKKLVQEEKIVVVLKTKAQKGFPNDHIAAQFYLKYLYYVVINIPGRLSNKNNSIKFILNHCNREATIEIFNAKYNQIKASYASPQSSLLFQLYLLNNSGFKFSDALSSSLVEHKKCFEENNEEHKGFQQLNAHHYGYLIASSATAASILALVIYILNDVVNDKSHVVENAFKKNPGIYAALLIPVLLLASIPKVYSETMKTYTAKQSIKTLFSPEILRAKVEPVIASQQV